MGVAQAAGDGGAHFHQAAVDGLDDVLFGDGLIKAGPAGAGIELGFGVEQGQVAADAAEDALLFKIPIRSREGALGVGVARDPIGRLVELATPFVVGFDDAGDGHGVRLFAVGGKLDDGDAGWTLIGRERPGGGDGAAAQSPERHGADGSGGGKDEGAAADTAWFRFRLVVEDSGAHFSTPL